MININLKKIQIPIAYIVFILFIVNSGFHLKNVPTYFSMYITFYIALLYLFFKSFKGFRVKLNLPMILCIVVILYLLLSQLLIGGNIIVSLAAIITFIFYIITFVITYKTEKNKILKICDLMLVYNILLYTIDAIYRFKSGGSGFFTNFYILKTNCLLFVDTNALAINSTILTFFSFYLFETLKKYKYLLYCLIFIIFTVLTFSRAAIIATFLSFFIITLFKTLKTIIKYFSNNKYYLMTLKTILIFVLLIPMIYGCIFLISKIINMLLNDGSFLTKINLFNNIVIFLENATISELLFGAGFDNAYIYLGRYAHTYLATYIVETGVVGYILITSFLLSILMENKKSLYILLPFFFLGFSYIGHTILNLFYVVLALICYFETGNSFLLKGENYEKNNMYV